MTLGPTVTEHIEHDPAKKIDLAPRPKMLPPLPLGTLAVR